MLGDGGDITWDTKRDKTARGPGGELKTWALKETSIFKFKLHHL